MLFYFNRLASLAFLTVALVSSKAVAACDPVDDPNPVIVSTGFNWPHAGPNNSGIFPTLMREAFCRIGRRVNVVRVPAARSIRQANAGLFFGEGPRRWSVVGQFADLLLLQPSLYELKFMAFSTKAFPSIHTYNDLAPYRAATVIGRKSVENNLRAVMEKFITASDEKLAFHMLKVGRVDFIVIDELTGMFFAKEAGIKTLHSAVLEKHPFHLLVHVNHRDQLSPLGTVLREMHADGTVNQIISNVVGQGTTKPIGD